MEAEDPPGLHAWEWKLRAGKAMEMGVKRDRKQWMAAQDDRVVHCECSCDREELLMVLLGPVTVDFAMLTSGHSAPMHLLPKIATLSLLWLCSRGTRT